MKIATSRLGWMVVACAWTAGCGAGTTSGPSADAGTGRDVAPLDGGVTDLGGSSDRGGAPDTGTVPPCPSSVPTEAGGCTREGVVCEYGDDPRVQCRTFATCTAARWSLAVPSCDPLPAAACPASREAADGQACGVEGAFCAYAGLACECTNCIRYPVGRCEGARTWHCDAPTTATSCPSARPRAGTVCGTEGLSCDYGCEPTRARRCVGGLWAPADSPAGCPRSTRAAKRDIAYLTPSDAERLSREVLATRLATYEYTDALLAGRRRLGFILEDQSPTSYAREPDRSSVDLYGYTSMLVATVQAQDRRIRALEATVAAMRRRR